MKTNQQTCDLGTTNALIIELLCGLSVDQDLSQFSRTAEAMSFSGKTAKVSFDLTNASVQIYCKGQEISVYDSKVPGQCRDIEFADKLGMEAVAEMIAATREQSEQERALVLAKIAKRPW